MHHALHMVWTKRQAGVPMISMRVAAIEPSARYQCRFSIPHLFSVRLVVVKVCRDTECWEWCLTDAFEGLDLYKGSETSLLSAQVAVQIAYEYWLQNQGKGCGIPNPKVYHWEAA